MSEKTAFTESTESDEPTIRITPVDTTSPELLDRIGDFITEAFLTAEHADGTEAALSRHLRVAPHRALPGLEFAAWDGDKLVGHILLSRTGVALENGEQTGQSLPAVLLAPLSVKLSHRRRGVGAALCRRAIDAARDAGERVVVVLGDPAYYGRFGFEPFRGLGLRVEGDEADELLPYCGVNVLLEGKEGKCFRDLLSGGRVDMLMREVFAH